MQLKRDTDYAIRILLVMAELAQNKTGSMELNLKAICDKTSAPHQIVLRLCNLLSDAGFIEKKETKGIKTYIPADNLLDKTLLDIIYVIEGRFNLFAVFDRHAEVYEKYGLALASVNVSLLDELNKISIQRILDCGQPKFIPGGQCYKCKCDLYYQNPEKN